jgi:hypothetical protein
MGPGQLVGAFVLGSRPHLGVEQGDGCLGNGGGRRPQHPGEGEQPFFSHQGGALVEGSDQPVEAGGQFRVGRDGQAGGQQDALDPLNGNPTTRRHLVHRQDGAVAPSDEVARHRREVSQAVSLDHLFDRCPPVGEVLEQGPALSRPRDGRVVETCRFQPTLVHGSSVS